MASIDMVAPSRAFPPSETTLAAHAHALDLAQITIRGFDGTIRLWTRGMERLCGYSAQEANGQISHQLLKTEFPRSLSTIEAELLERGEWSGELQHVHRSGNKLNVVTHWSLSQDERSAQLLVLEASHDATELKRMRQRDALLGDVLESSQDAVVIKTLNGIVTDLNPAAESLYGFAAAELRGKSIFLLYPPRSVGEEKEIMRKIVAGERVEHFETTRRRKDGSEVEVSLSISPVHDDIGRIVGASHVARDLTERNTVRLRLEALQASLARLARINTMGQMASALAHELNQPLTALNNYLAAACRVATQDQVDRALLDASLQRAREQASRTVDVINHLRTYIGKGAPDRSLTDINEVVADSVRLGTLDAKRVQVSVTMDLDRTIEPLMVDPVQIGQIVVNLVRNAVEAMEDSPRRELAVFTKTADTSIDIIVCDTGPGIPPDILPGLFQPFVTSKSTGMGLGLSICKDLVQAHGGMLTGTSRPGGGTTFKVSLSRRS